MAWRDPPDELREAWNEAAHRTFGGAGAGVCPRNDEHQLRYFFVRFDESERAVESRGGFWIWCPHCRTYEHGSARVPAWWQDVDVPLDELTHDPAWLDEHWDDDWLRRQPSAG